MGLPVGPWLTELKKVIREDQPGDMEIDVSGRRFTLETLRGIATITKGQKISYVTDVSSAVDNVHKIIEFVDNSDILYCEAYFLDKDRDRAMARFHLTAKTTGMIAREAKVQNLVVMHFSSKYRDIPENLEQEAMEEFYKK